MRNIDLNRALGNNNVFIQVINEIFLIEIYISFKRELVILVDCSTLCLIFKASKNFGLVALLSIHVNILT